MKRWSLNFLILILLTCSCNRDIDNEELHLNSEKTENNEVFPAATETDTTSFKETGLPSSENTEIQNQQSAALFNFSSISFWEIAVLISFGFNVILLTLFTRLYRRNSSLNTEVKGKNNELVSINNLLKGKDFEIRNLKDQVEQFDKLKKRAALLVNNKEESLKRINKPTREKEQISYEDEKPVEVDLSPTSTTILQPKKVNTTTTLYAGKPGKENIFTEVSPQKDEHRSFYRLILEDKDAQTASFEVLDTEYILRMAANSPDTYLFSVCKPENSNQNFDGKIITTQKGKARLLDGSWKVNDEDKAKIKFE